MDSQKNFDLIKTMSGTSNAYYIFLYTSRQLNDIEKFCCSGRNPVSLAIDTTFNLCDLRLTDTPYENKRILNETNWNKPVLCFTKDAEAFSRFFVRTLSWESQEKKIWKVLDMEAATFNGFKIQGPNFGRLICVLHLRKRDEVKASHLHTIGKGQSNSCSKIKVQKRTPKRYLQRKWRYILRVWFSRSLWWMWFQCQARISVTEVWRFNSRLFQMVFCEQKEIICRKRHRVSTRWHRRSWVVLPKRHWRNSCSSKMYPKFQEAGCLECGSQFARVRTETRYRGDTSIIWSR